MNVEYYTGVNQRLDVPVMLPPVPSAVDLSGARVLHQKPQSTIDCEGVWRRTDRWIEFRWSS
jgi:uncharacterized protein